MEIVSSSDQHVHRRTSNGSVVMMITIYYGCNSASDRKHLWDSLLQCSNNVNLPWIVLGDFNIIRWSHEKRGGAVSNYVDMKCFNDCIDSCGLDDFALKGPIFTWSNSSSESSRVECRLDRCLKNTAFNLVTVDYQGLVLNNSLFDHCPILISTSAVMKARFPFRFFNYWAKVEGFFAVVKKAWEINVVGTPMFPVIKKLSNVKRCLRECNKSKPPVSVRITNARAVLDDSMISKRN